MGALSRHDNPPIHKYDPFNRRTNSVGTTLARNDIKVIWPTQSPFSVNRIVGSGGAATIQAGEPTKSGSSGAVAIMADGDGTTSQKFSGIAKNTSTDTAAAAGVVSVYMPFPGMVYAGKAKSTTAADTQAEIDALMDKRVVFDLTSGAWTVDSAASNAATNGLVIVGGDFRSNMLYFAVSPQCTIFDNPTTA